MKNPDKSPLYKFPLNCSRGFCAGVLSGGLLSGRFCPGWFLSVPLLSEYICYNRKLNITLNFMFPMYDALDPTCHKQSHRLGPLPPSSVTYFMDGPHDVGTHAKVYTIRLIQFRETHPLFAKSENIDDIYLRIGR